MRLYSSVLLILLLMSCTEKPVTQLQNGNYLGELEANPNVYIPFNFEVTSPTSLKIFNAEEVIPVDAITYSNDSVYIDLPVFQTRLVVKLNNEGMTGEFVNANMDKRLPFRAIYDVASRFKQRQPAQKIVNGNWEVTFSPDNEAQRYLAKGVFEQKDSQVTGTFKTKTGDYRFLEGIMDGDSLKLSTFDGVHAYLFKAKVSDSTMTGLFYSGNTWVEPFIATRNEAFELPDANTLTALKEGYDEIAFRFPDGSGNWVSLNDDRFKDKVVVVQIMGTWCPNCLDESRYFSEFYTKNKTEDLAFVALAFEYAKTEAQAFKSIKGLKERVGISYPILLAQYGGSDKLEAQKKLPMLTHVLSYPTTIFIDKKGKVRKIHTGFNGPATGRDYTDFKKEFESFINQLLSE